METNQKEECAKYLLHEDPGHTWLQVPLAELDKLGIRDKISRYSYTDGVSAYLEEDCDMGKFLAAKNGGNAPKTWAEAETVCKMFTVHSDKDSFVRGLKRMNQGGKP